jgi:aminodeoxyfutalosine deaminase
MTADAELRAFATALPKAELHVHLEGSIPPELALRLAQRHGVRLPGDEGGAAGVAAAFRFVDFSRFIKTYLALSRCLQTADDVREVVVALAERLRGQGVVHAEVTFTPVTHLARGVPQDVLLDGLEQGRDAAAAIGVSIAYVLDIVRSFLDQAEPTLAFALALQRRIDRGVAGLGLAGPEGGDHPYAPMVDVFARARAAGLRSLPHAGEMLGPPSVRAAIEQLQADRIGHGVRAVEDPEVVALLVQRGIPLEVCPSSNVALGVYPDLASHSLPRLHAAGVAFSIATDDPSLFGVDLVDEYLRAAAMLGGGAQVLRSLAEASLRHATLDEPSRTRWLAAAAGVPEPD